MPSQFFQLWENIRSNSYAMTVADINDYRTTMFLGERMVQTRGGLILHDDVLIARDYFEYHYNVLSIKAVNYLERAKKTEKLEKGIENWKNAKDVLLILEKNVEDTRRFFNDSDTYRERIKTVAVLQQELDSIEGYLGNPEAIKNRLSHLQLENQLELAIRKEDYESAAKLREELKSCRQ